MKTVVFAVLILFINSLQAQVPSSKTPDVKIHSHNDYEKAEPLFNALRHKAFTIEADVYLVNGELMVAHDRKDIKPERTLTKMYLDPIDSLFKNYSGTVSKDNTYRPTLAVDIKSDGEASIAALIKLLSQRAHAFDPAKNRNAIVVIVSGDRGSISKWKTYPSFIMFDGRPSETYDAQTLKKVVSISDSYGNYYKNNTLNTEALSAVIAKAHSQQKLVRIWGAPDFATTWKLFQQIGVDIINTDKIGMVRKELNQSTP